MGILIYLGAKDMRESHSSICFIMNYMEVEKC